MGIDFSHAADPEVYSRCCPSWSYSGFNHFRKALAEAEGFDLDEMQGFSKGTWDLDGDCRVSGTRCWDEITSDLKPLLNHSDCDGELTPEECAQVFPRLREIADGLSNHYDESGALRLAACMETCAIEGTTLEFC